MELENNDSYLDRLKKAWPYEWDPLPSILISAYVGSTAHKTSLPSTDPAHIDDVDLLTVLQPPREFVYGLTQWTHYCPPVGTLQELDIVNYSVQKLASLLIKGNPNVLCLLWAPPGTILKASPLWQDWLDNRQAFLSEKVYTSFAGYAADQLRRLGHPSTRGYMGAGRKKLFETYGYDLKNAAHCLRLLRMGVELAKTGELKIDRSKIDADELRSIKKGEWTLERLQKEAELQFAAFEIARNQNPLPISPDLKTIQKLLINTVEKLWVSREIYVNIEGSFLSA